MIKKFKLAKPDSKHSQDDVCYNLDTGHFAITDGVSGGFYSGILAELLVQHFCTGTINGLALQLKSWEAWLKPVQAKWKERVVQEVSDFAASATTASQDSMVRQKQSRLRTFDMAASTFIGLKIDSPEEETTRWQAMVIGDSCLFQISDDDSVQSWPIKTFNQFPSIPPCFGSYVRCNAKYKPDFISGTANAGDKFILATDALAKWIMQHFERNSVSKTLAQLEAINDDQEFEQFVNLERNNKIRLENDDTTLLIVSI